MSDDLSDAKVGTKLLVTRSYPTSVGWIETVQHITPTGRVVTKISQFNRDGFQRGEHDRWNRKFARIATEEDMAKIYRARLIDMLATFKWDKLTNEDLKAVATILVKGKE